MSNIQIRASIGYLLLCEGYGVNNFMITRTTLLRLFGSSDQIRKNKGLSEQGLTIGKYTGQKCKFSPEHPVAYPQWLWSENMIVKGKGEYDISRVLAETIEFMKKQG